MYTKPEFMVEQFDVEDIITDTSGTVETSDPFESKQISIEGMGSIT